MLESRVQTCLNSPSVELIFSFSKWICFYQKYLLSFFQCGSPENIASIVSEAEEMFKSKVKESIQKLALAIPEGQYFRFQQFFCHSIQVNFVRYFLIHVSFYLLFKCQLFIIMRDHSDDKLSVLTILLLSEIVFLCKALFWFIFVKKPPEYSMTREV
jgi:hypothetical protein